MKKLLLLQVWNKLKNLSVENKSVEYRKSNIGLIMSNFYPELEYEIHPLKAPYKLGYYESNIYFKLEVTNLITYDSLSFDFYTLKDNVNINGTWSDLRRKIIRDMRNFLSESIALG